MEGETKERRDGWGHGWTDGENLLRNSIYLKTSYL